MMVDVLSALSASTLGCVLIRVIMNVRYSSLAMGLMVNFCVLCLFVFLPPMLSIPEIVRWGGVTCVGALLFCGWSSLLKDFFPAPFFEIWFRNIFPLLIVGGGGFIVIKEKWWLAGLISMDPIYASVMVLGTASIMMFGGAFLFLHGRDSDHA